MPYIGRFAPSPTGALHLGSLLAATGSFLDARAHNGKWLLRIEDIDTPRIVPGSADLILRTLTAFGLYWDETETYQSQHLDRYQNALTILQQQEQVYPCICSRKQIRQTGSPGLEGAVYAGTCKERKDKPLERPHSWRLKAPDEHIVFVDQIEGQQTQNLAQQIGDFVLKRADGLWAYQLAVVVDDAASGVTHIVRGNDLLTSTARQIYLQRCLQYSTPVYAHLPILVNSSGQKLSKQTLAPAINTEHALSTLKQVLVVLNLSPPREIDTLPDLLQWATHNWRLHKLPRGTILA